MPIFEIETQDGRKFQVEAPDMQSAEAEIDGMGPQVGTGEDMMRSAAAGVGQGVVGLAGLPGDVRSLSENVIGPALNRIGFDFQPTQRVQGVPDPFKTSAEFQRMANDATRPQGGQSFMEYRPQTTAGEYARTAGQFAPGVAAGPGSALVKAGTLAGSSIGSEAAGQATEGTAFEPYARFAGAVAGGGAPAAMLQRGGGKVPTTAQFQKAKNTAYNKASASGNTLPAMEYYKIVDDLEQMAGKWGADAGLTPKTMAAIRALKKRVNDKDLSVDEIDQARQRLKLAEDVMKPKERALIRRMVTEFDRRVDMSVPAELKEARRLNVRYKKSELMDELNDRAELKAGQYSQSGSENAQRSMYRQLAMNKAKMRQFDAAEREAIRAVAKGTKPANAARWVGKFAPTSAISALPAILMGGGAGLGGGSTLGAMVGGTVAGAGMAGKAIASALTSKRAKIAEELVRGGRLGAASAREARDQQRLEQIARALLAGHSSQVGR